VRLSHVPISTLTYMHASQPCTRVRVKLNKGTPWPGLYNVTTTITCARNAIGNHGEKCTENPADPRVADLKRTCVPFFNCPDCLVLIANPEIPVLGKHLWLPYIQETCFNIFLNEKKYQA